MGGTRELLVSGLYPRQFEECACYPGRIDHLMQMLARHDPNRPAASSGLGCLGLIPLAEKQVAAPMLIPARGNRNILQVVVQWQSGLLFDNDLAHARIWQHRSHVFFVPPACPLRQSAAVISQTPQEREKVVFGHRRRAAWRGD